MCPSSKKRSLQCNSLQMEKSTRMFVCLFFQSWEYGKCRENFLPSAPGVIPNTLYETFTGDELNMNCFYSICYDGANLSFVRRFYNGIQTLQSCKTPFEPVSTKYALITEVHRFSSRRCTFFQLPFFQHSFTNLNYIITWLFWEGVKKE